MNGIDNLEYIRRRALRSAAVRSALTFATGTNPDIAGAGADKLACRNVLPQIVQQQGITVTKSTSSFLMVVGFASEDGALNSTDLADYIASNIKDPLAASPASGKCSSSARNMPCASGSIPTSSQKDDLMPGDVAGSRRGRKVSAGAVRRTHRGRPAAQCDHYGAESAETGRSVQKHYSEEQHERIHRPCQRRRQRRDRCREYANDGQFNHAPAAGWPYSWRQAPMRSTPPRR